MSPLHRPDLPAYALAALAILGIVILAAMHVPIPPVLEGAVLIGGAGGVALPTTPTRGQRATDNPTTTRGGR